MMWWFGVEGAVNTTVAREKQFSDANMKAAKFYLEKKEVKMLRMESG